MATWRAKARAIARATAIDEDARRDTSGGWVGCIVEVLEHTVTIIRPARNRGSLAGTRFVTGRPSGAHVYANATDPSHNVFRGCTAAMRARRESVRCVAEWVLAVVVSSGLRAPNTAGSCKLSRPNCRQKRQVAVVSSKHAVRQHNTSGMTHTLQLQKGQFER